MSIKLIPMENYRTTKWSGGVTTELFIWPEGSSYAERRFSFRISSALVELEESVFTRLEGVKRYLTPLENGFTLTVNGSALHLERGEVLEFSGEDDVKCVGTGRDLNLMLKGCDGIMKPVSGAFRVYESEHALVYSPGGARIDSKGDTVILPAGGLAELSIDEYSAEGEAWLFLVGGLTNGK